MSLSRGARCGGLPDSGGHRSSDPLRGCRWRVRGPHRTPLLAFRAMRSRVNRARGLVQRYRVDRRLPPQVLRIYRDVARLRRVEGAHERAARARPALRTTRGDAPRGPLVRQGGRRVEARGVLEMSLTDLAQAYAEAIVTVLDAAAVDPFIIDRRRDSIVLGIELRFRSRALESLAADLVGPGWLLDWEDGSRSGTVALLDAARSPRSDGHARGGSTR